MFVTNSKFVYKVKLFYTVFICQSGEIEYAFWFAVTLTLWQHGSASKNPVNLLV